MEQEDIEQVVGGILSIAQRERRSSEPYKRMWQSDGVEGVLRSVYDRMISPVLDAYMVLEEKHGITGDEVFRLLLALPYLENQVEESVTKNDGHVCCVDKTYFLLAEKLREAGSK